jgi:hypothetical protein
MICTAPPLVTLKDTVQSNGTEVVDNKVRVLLYVSGIPPRVAKIEQANGLLHPIQH